MNIFSKIKNTYKIVNNSNKIVQDETEPGNLEGEYTETLSMNKGVQRRLTLERIEEIKQLVEGVIDDMKSIAQDRNFPLPIIHEEPLQGPPPPTIEISKINEINSREDIEGKEKALKKEILGPILEKRRRLPESSMIVINGKYAQNPKNKHKQDYKKKLEYNKPRAQYQTIEKTAKGGTRVGRHFIVNFINDKAIYTTVR